MMLLAALLAAASSPAVSREQAIAIAARHVAAKEHGRSTAGAQVDVFSTGHTWRIVFVPPMPRLGGASVVKVDKQTGRVTGYHHDQ